MKGVILAGGTGTRLHPLTQITNKHLLPIYDRPMVTYAIEALVRAGINELMLVTGGTHAGEFFRLLGNGHDYGIDRLFYGYQEEAGGIAEALGLAERFVGGDRVVVMLADNVFERSIRPAVENFARQERGARIVLAREADVDHLRHLGVPELDGDGRVTRIVEKPESPPSEFAVTGVYFYDADVFDVIPTLEPSGRGELEITDVNNHYVGEGTMEYDVVEGFWGDAGESIDVYYAVNDFVRANGANKERDAHPAAPLRRRARLVHGADALVPAAEARAPVERLVLAQGRDPRPALPRAGAGRPLRVRAGHRAGRRARPRQRRGVHRGHRRRESRRDLRSRTLAHGYEALTDCVFLYHVTEEYDPDDPDEHGVCWADDRVKHLWSTDQPILSERDTAACS